MSGEIPKNDPKAPKEAKDSKDKLNTSADAVKNLGKEGIKKSLAGTKAGAGGTTSPGGNVLGGVREAASALKNKDAMGAVDAGVRTGTVAGATALGGTLAGSATDFVLKTKVGRKITRIVSVVVVANVLIMVTSLLMMILIAGGAISAIFGGFGGATTGLYDPTQVQPITDPISLKVIDVIILKNIQLKKPIDDAVLGTLDYLSNNGSTPFSVDSFYSSLAKNKVSNTPILTGVDSTGKAIHIGSASSSSQVPYNSTTDIAPWDALPIVDPSIVDAGSSSPTLEYALFYESAYKTVVNELKTNEIFKSHSGLASTVSDWTPELQTLIAQADISSTGVIGNPTDANGNLIDSGIFLDSTSKFTDGPPLASSYGFNRNRALALSGQQGDCVTAGCNLECERLTEYVYGKSGVWMTATDNWKYVLSKGYATTVGSQNGLNPPVGAWLFWNSGADGHVATYMGGGYALSNWNDGHGGSSVQMVKASEVTNRAYRYLGWAYPVTPSPSYAGGIFK